MTIRREDPPEARSGSRPSTHHLQIAEKLKADPGNWYVIDENSKEGQLATNINVGRVVAYRPAGSFEATSRRNAGQRSVTVWARYVGEAND